MTSSRSPVRALLLIALATSSCADGKSATDGTKVELPESYVRADPNPRLILEVDVVEGITPRAAASAYAVDRLGAVLDKPDGIEWTPDATLTPGGSNHVWTFEELQQLADESFDLEVDDDTAKIHVIYVDGSYENPGVLGVAWANRHLVMFAERLEESCDRPLIGERLCEVAESSVLLHELGHVIGLVDNGVEMVEPHKDAEHGAHDESDECVMYWAYEGADIVDVLADRLSLGGSSAELDFGPNCQADLAAVRD